MPPADLCLSEDAQFTPKYWESSGIGPLNDAQGDHVTYSGSQGR